MSKELVLTLQPASRSPVVEDLECASVLLILTDENWTAAIAAFINGPERYSFSHFVTATATRVDMKDVKAWAALPKATTVTKDLTTAVDMSAVVLVKAPGVSA